MSSDEDDFLNYTPLQRSQVSVRESKPTQKASRLSLSFKKRQKIKGEVKVKESPSKSSKGSKAVKKTPVKNSRSAKKTPIKSRADQPNANCSQVELTRWKFLFGSKTGEGDEKPQTLKTNENSGGESANKTLVSPLQQKRKSVSEECVAPNVIKKQDVGTCVHCKFPFDIHEEKSLHSFLCESKDLSHLPKCYAGNECWETREQHFWKYNHNEDSNNSTSDSGFDCIGGPSTNGIPSNAAVLVHESPEIVVLSDAEDNDVYNHNSMPLFELQKSESLDAHTDKGNENRESQVGGERNSAEEQTSKKCFYDETSRESSDLLAPLIEPDVELFEDDQTTVCFEGKSESQSVHSPSHEEENQDNPNTPVNHIPSDHSGSKTPDLIHNDETEVGLEDSEGDDLIASLVEESVDRAVPAIEKVIEWRKGCREAQDRTSTPQRNQSHDLQKSPKSFVPPVCIHLHFHEASSAPTPSRESGQMSIRSFFKPTTSKAMNCACGEKKTVTSQENVKAWQELMGRRTHKKKLTPLPSVSQSSSTLQTQSTDEETTHRWRRKPMAEKKTCPFYKYIPDTSIVVDAFSYGSVDGVTAYFLSHFHYDHYCGLNKKFSHPIYCSEITARLVNKRLGVSNSYLHPLPMWEPQQVCGVEVTLLEANHCPGAVMFLFKVKEGVTHLHVGDFRAHPSMENYAALHRPINTLFLDTTYCSPEHVFPTQERMIEKCVSLCQDHHQRNNNTLFVVGSYTIGKERVFKAIASSLNCSIWVKDYKKQVLNCISDKEIQDRLINSRACAKLHVLPMSEVKGQKLKDYLNHLKSSFSEIVGICPTGWEYSGKSSSKEVDGITCGRPYPDVYTYGVPYSEHSNFNELKRFVQFIKPKKITPTVNNGNPASRKMMQQHFREWLHKPLFS